MPNAAGAAARPIAARFTALRGDGVAAAGVLPTGAVRPPEEILQAYETRCGISRAAPAETRALTSTPRVTIAHFLSSPTANIMKWMMIRLVRPSPMVVTVDLRTPNVDHRFDGRFCQGSSAMKGHSWRGGVVAYTTTSCDLTKEGPKLTRQKLSPTLPMLQRRWRCVWPVTVVTMLWLWLKKVSAFPSAKGIIGLPAIKKTRRAFTKTGRPATLRRRRGASSCGAFMVLLSAACWAGCRLSAA